MEPVNGVIERFRKRVEQFVFAAAFQQFSHFAQSSIVGPAKQMNTYTYKTIIVSIPNDICGLWYIHV